MYSEITIYGTNINLRKIIESPPPMTLHTDMGLKAAAAPLPGPKVRKAGGSALLDGWRHVGWCGPRALWSEESVSHYVPQV